MLFTGPGSLIRKIVCALWLFSFIMQDQVAKCIFGSEVQSCLKVSAFIHVRTTLEQTQKIDHRRSAEKSTTKAFLTETGLRLLQIVVIATAIIDASRK